jgi:hypothetical protein
LLGVAVEACDSAQPTGDRGSSSAASLEIASEALEVRPADREEPQVVFLAPAMN